MSEIDGRELARLLDPDHVPQGLGPVLVDVREDVELSLAPFPARVVHIPLHELAYRAPRELDPDRAVVTICHHGLRSLRAVGVLQAAGFREVRSLRGGIDRWALEIDPEVPRY